MPRWNLDDLPEAPTFTWRNWLGMIGPGVLMGGMAIGGGEWLMGPLITARFGGSLLWLALLSILGQVIYNIEISRYTLYTGEPIFTGKFRTLPGPRFWVFVYFLLDFGMFFPYLAASASTPLAALWLGEIPNPQTNQILLRSLSTAIVLLSVIPLVIGGKIYNALKALMMFKIIVVLGFLLIVAVFFSRPSTWVEIFSGFFKIGNVPVHLSEGIPQPSGSVGDSATTQHARHAHPSEQSSGSSKAPTQPSDVDNVLIALYEGRPLPKLDLTMVAFLCALVAISGNGGLGNTPISNYTRDQGWGMGAHVGAIPSLIGGHAIQLSHVGSVFEITSETLPRWQRWYRHICRDQLAVWFPACLLGIALPCMLSVEFLPRGFQVEDQWLASVMTAEAIRDSVGPQWGGLFWFMTIFCGFLVLGVTVGPATDGFLRRWVDVCWTSSRSLRTLEPGKIRHVYFVMLSVYTIICVTMLWIGKPTTLLLIAGLIMNFALGISCWHTLIVNLVLLPPELRPGWFVRVALCLTGLFFFSVAALSTGITLSQEGWL